ncbi:dynamin family protein [Romboutsia sedimentorum]|uniref:Dynamin family protein n=1 Tax=Romboutsia sedimentorum TaxID=1368474 RepID=A0ABT7EAA3_9FIRM|nr:dynamin family protein [Romboutsia sedimentorum]MDK2563853.1 dynamin family protein [Romboutsia sedimentorum]
MYDSRYEEYKKMMNIINELNDIIILAKESINNNRETKSSKLLDYIQNKLNESGESISQLKEPFLLFVMGSGNYGKSTLINALLKRNIVISTDIPNTWKLDLFVKKNNEKIEIIYSNNKKITKSLINGNKLLKNEEDKFKNSKIKVSQNVAKFKRENKLSINELKKYKQQQENENLYKSEIVKVRYNLKDGNMLDDFIIVDTPGLNQILLKDTLERMKEYYTKADGVLWLVDACNIVSKESNKLIDEMNKIDNLHNNKKNIIAVVNKMDIISKADAANIAKVKGKANEIYIDKFDDVVYISAKEAVDGILNNDCDLIQKSNIDSLYKSIDVNFTKISKIKQIDSKYKNIFIMRDNIIKEVYDYKRELYKDISNYNEIEFESKKKSKEIYIQVLNYIEDIKSNNTYNDTDLNDLKTDIEKLQIKCNLDLEKLYEVLYEKANINKSIDIEKLNTNVYFARSKNLILEYNKSYTLDKNNIKKANQLENILNKLNPKNPKKQYIGEILTKGNVYKRINNLKNEISEILEDRISFIDFNINKIKDEAFKEKYLEYSKIKKHIQYLNEIENILNNLR